MPLYVFVIQMENHWEYIWHQKPHQDIALVVVFDLRKHEILAHCHHLKTHIMYNSVGMHMLVNNDYTKHIHTYILTNHCTVDCLWD